MPSKSDIVSFDQLPVELIEKIFRYLHYYDIFHGFRNINTRLNNILYSYNRYSLNLQSISLSLWNLTLPLIRSEQIISLTLSNLDDTPGEMQLFLSTFSLEQFHRLESLHILQPTKVDDLNRILISLPRLNHLISLAILHCQPSSVNSETFQLLTSFLNQSTSLRRLALSGAFNTLFESHFHSSIDHLYLNDNIFNTTTFSIVNTRMSQLKSLETSITSPINSSDLIDFIHLTRLTVTIFVRMSNADLKNLFIQMPRLLYLKITANGKQWFNGHFWEQSLPVDLKRFQFNFCTQSIHLNDSMILETFQTPFWLENKRWYVMLDYQMNPTMAHLYSLPYGDRQFYYRPSNEISRQFRSSAPVDRFYMKSVAKLTVDFSALVTESNPSLTSPHYFPNVSTLVLSDNSYFVSIPPLFSCLQSIVDLSGVVELILGHFHYPDLIRLVHSSMPRLQTLRIAETMFAKLEMLDFRHIRSLIVCDSLTNVDRLCLMFPQLTHLSLRLTTFERMRRVIELLDQTIRNVTFKHANATLQNQFLPWLNKHRPFTYEIDQHMSLHIWLTDPSR